MINPAIVDFIAYCPETGEFRWKKEPPAKHPVGSLAGTIHSGYLYICFGSKGYYAHRIAWLIMTGSEPSQFVDHKNLDKLDNRWANLREATRAQNTQNCRAKGSLPKGVTASLNKFKAQIRDDGKNYYLGTFDTAEQAHAAYVAAALKHFGEFARAA